MYCTVQYSTRTRTWAAGMIIAQQYEYSQEGLGCLLVQQSTLPPGGEAVRVQTRRDHRYKVLVLVRPWYDAETRDPRDTDVRVLFLQDYE